MHKPTISSFCLLLLSAVIALKLGFFTFDGTQAVGIVKYTGYWVMLTSVALLVHNFILRVIPCLENSISWVAGGIWRSSLHHHLFDCAFGDPADGLQNSHGRASTLGNCATDA